MTSSDKQTVFNEESLELQRLRGVELVPSPAYNKGEAPVWVEAAKRGQKSMFFSLRGDIDGFGGYAKARVEFNIDAVSGNQILWPEFVARDQAGRPGLHLLARDGDHCAKVRTIPDEKGRAVAILVDGKPCFHDDQDIVVEEGPDKGKNFDLRYGSRWLVDTVRGKTLKLGKTRLVLQAEKDGVAFFHAKTASYEIVDALTCAARGSASADEFGAASAAPTPTAESRERDREAARRGREQGDGAIPG